MVVDVVDVELLLPHPLTARVILANRSSAQSAGQRRRRNPGSPIRRNEANATPEKARVSPEPPAAEPVPNAAMRLLPVEAQALSDVLMVTAPFVTVPLVLTLGFV